MARPKKDNPRSVRVVIYLSQEEVDYLNTRAKEINLSRGKLISDILGNIIFGEFAPITALKTMMKLSEYREKLGIKSKGIVNPFKKLPYDYKDDKMFFNSDDVTDEEVRSFVEDKFTH